MSGTAIIAELLLARPELLELVPVAQIKQGAIAQDIPLPALLIKMESSVDAQFLKQGRIVRSVERISVTIRAENYRQQKAVLRQVRSAGVGVFAAIGDASRISSRTAGRGPDLRGPDESFEQTQDFRVTFDAAA